MNTERGPLDKETRATIAHLNARDPATGRLPIDLRVANHGSIFLLTPESKSGQQWVDQYLPDDAMMIGGSYVVEHRYIGDIVEGARQDGLTVQ
jgi:hypothetical protein